jgi:hypothetical protein
MHRIAAVTSRRVRLKERCAEITSAALSAYKAIDRAAGMD